MEARGLGQRLRGRTILRGCTFALAPGVTALLGPNGAGKSVLLRTLAGVLPPVGGGVWLDGRRAGPRRLHHAVVCVAQFPGVHPWLSVRGHLERAAAWSGAQRPRAMADAAVERLGLAREAGVPAGRVPVAARRRLAIAEAWLRGCRVLLLDEPTADLNPEERAAFWAEVARLRGSRDGTSPRAPDALLLTTHLLDEVEAYCHFALVLSAGRVLFAGGVDALADRAAGACFRLPPAAEVPPGFSLVGATPGGGQEVLAGPEEGGPPADPGTAAPGALARAALPAGAAPRGPTLLDGYLRLVEGGAG